LQVNASVVRTGVQHARAAEMLRSTSAMINLSRFAVLLVALSSAAQERVAPGLSVSIAPSGTGRVEYRQPKDHFHVILSNTSSKAQRVFQDSNSWGYYSLSFELEDPGGKKWVAKKKRTAFSRNVPSWLEIPPGENLVIDVYWGDESAWEGFPPFETEKNLKVRAVFEIKPDAETKQFQVWTGRMTSPTQKVVFSKWRADK
jgi:hypothetical protein